MFLVVYVAAFDRGKTCSILDQNKVDRSIDRSFLLGSLGYVWDFMHLLKVREAFI